VERRLRQLGALTLAHPVEELVEREALACSGPDAHLAPEVLADLVGQLGGQVVGHAVGEPLGQRFQRRPNGTFGVTREANRARDWT